MATQVPDLPYSGDVTGRREFLPGVPECEVTERSETKLLCDHRPAPPRCPVCGLVAVRNGRLTRAVHDLPRGGVPQELYVSGSRWAWRCRCPGADGEPQPPPPAFQGLTDARPRVGERARPVTGRLQSYLLDAWGRGRSVRSLGLETGLQEEHVRTLVQDRLTREAWRSRYPVRERRPGAIGLDEIFWRGQPLTIVVDIGEWESSQGSAPHARVIDILPSRSPEVLEQFFRQMRHLMREAGDPSWAPVIASDLWGDFRIVIRRVFGGSALHVADRFHVAAKIVEDLRDAAEQYATFHLPLGASREKAAQRRAVLASVRRSERRYRQLLREKTPVEPEADPRLRKLVDLAVDLGFLWDRQSTPQTAARQFRIWRSKVEDWNKTAAEAGSHDLPLRAFGRLIYLLEAEGWLLEVTNYLHPRARLTPQGSPVPTQTPPPEVRRASTGRVEGLNRTIRLLGRRSPNPRRTSWAGTDWSRWHEEEQFRRYRERLFWALNVPVTQPAPLQRRLEATTPPCRCGQSLDGVAPTHTVARRAWDIPVVGHRVQACWVERSLICPACRARTRHTVEESVPVTAGLRTYLSRALQRGETVHALGVATGASRSLLTSLLTALPPPPPQTIPAVIGALPFQRQRRQHVLITDLATGRPVALLPGQTAGEGPQVLWAWLCSVDAAEVRSVFVEERRWLPPSSLPVDVTFVFDRFSTTRLIQPAIQALQRQYTATLPISARRTPFMRGHRKILLRSADPASWPLLDRIHKEESEVLRGHMLRHGALNTGLEGIDALRGLLRSPQLSQESLEGWISQQRAVFNAAWASSDEVERQELRHVWMALRRCMDPLEDPAVRQAVLGGALAAQRQDGSLARSRRYLQDLQNVPAFRSRSPQAWQQLEWVALTQVGR